MPTIRENVNTTEAASEMTSLVPQQYQIVGKNGAGLVQLHQGSLVVGAVFNFTNSILGAGAIGLASAIANSGGLISIISIVFFAVLSKFSFDLIVSLAVETDGAQGSYEQLGSVAYGNAGRLAVMISKFLYSFGCLVAYIVIVKDNAASALQHLFYGRGPYIDVSSGLAQFLMEEDLVTVILSATIILPLCLLRDMSRLQKVSAVKIIAVLAIVIIVAYLWISNPDGTIRTKGGTAFENWWQVRKGFFESVGTFVFTFVAHHAVHLIYNSLRSDVRNMDNWRTVSTWSVSLATALSLGVGLFVYVTFWKETSSSLLELYPPLQAIDFAKLLLCTMIMFTYPVPFFSCRELIIVAMPKLSTNDVENSAHDDSDWQAWWLIPGGDLQLIRPLHITITVLLWAITTLLAIVAPSLGDVLNLVGCATGTVIAFVLPALFSFKLRGYSHLAMFIMAVGGTVGLVGTYFSLKKLVEDLFY